MKKKKKNKVSWLSGLLRLKMFFVLNLPFMNGSDTNIWKKIIKYKNGILLNALDWNRKSKKKNN